MEKKLTFLAIGAHANEMEKTCPFLIKYARLGHKVVIVNCTAGESGHPKLSQEEYRALKKEEAGKIRELTGIAEQRFLPFVDGMLPANDEAKWMICDIIREVKPDIIATHWKGSDHKDHRATYEIVKDGIFWAGLPAVKRKDPFHAVKRVFYTDNWEDWEGYSPNVFIEIDEESYNLWEKATLIPVSSTGAHNGFMAIDLYRGLLKMRGAQSGVFKYAQAAYTPVQIKTKDVFTELNEIKTAHDE